MPRILLINPNTSTVTTSMMVAIARAALPYRFSVFGTTARSGVDLIVTPLELAASEAQVAESWANAGDDWDGVMVSCFGDPGVDDLRKATAVPIVGICEASMLEASRQGRRFGVATTTPDLEETILARARTLGLASLYSGMRVTQGNPRALVADPIALKNAMADAVSACVQKDGAAAVIVGGGPLGQVAIELDGLVAVPLVAPIVAAARHLQVRLSAHERSAS